MGLLYAGLASGGLGGVPSRLAARLSSAYARQLAHNHLVLAEMRRVLQALDGLDGLDVMVAKGLALAAIYYRDTGIRPTADIDLIIRYADFGGVAAALAGLGYSAKADYQEKLELYCHVTFEREGSAGVPVEAHWSLGRDFPSTPDDASLWRGAQVADIGGVRVRTLSAENHLLQAALHLAHHAVFGGYPSLLWLADVALLSGQPGVCWQAVGSSAAEQGFARAAYLSLALSQRLLDGQFPAEVRRQLAPLAGAVPALADRGLADRLVFGGVPAPVRQMLAASFQGAASRRGRYLAKHWVKPALKAVGLKR